MKLETGGWRVFEFGMLIDRIYKAKANAKVELTISEDKLPGYIPFVSRTETNNGVDGYVLKTEISDIEQGNAIVIGDTTSTISYQPEEFATGDHIIVIRAKWLNQYTGLFVTTLLQKERFRYSYGRAYLIEHIKSTKLWLPVTKDQTPDWNWMEQYIQSLHSKRISTRVKKDELLDLCTESWQEFELHRVFDIEMGNGIDAVSALYEQPKYNYVSRTNANNGVVSRIDEIKGEKVYPAGAISLALGGSLGACFIQNEPFYTAQNVAVLRERETLSIYTKIFLTTIIRNECKVKYQPFGRELNSHIKKDFKFKLPVKQTERDDMQVYSDEGWIPDWAWMDNYIRRLPYSDRIFSLKI